MTALFILRFQEHAQAKNYSPNWLDKTNSIEIIFHMWIVLNIAPPRPFNSTMPFSAVNFVFVKRKNDFIMKFTFRSL